MSLPDESPSELFMRALRMPKAVAEALVAGEVTSIEELAYIPLEELLAVPSVERWLLLELREQARQHLLEGR
jgi:transcription termination/antitermination protein NusA